MERTIARKLADLGFTSTLGTREESLTLDQNKEIKANPEKAFRHGHNNGVFVVYDHRGIPWIRRGYLNPAEQSELELKDELRGVYVPHSNDCGMWVQKFLDKK